MSNYQLANELHKQIIKKSKRKKVYSLFEDNIWGVDLAYMQPLRRYKIGIKYLFCAINLFGKYTWVFLLKDNRGISIVNSFQKSLESSKNSKAKSKRRKPNKIWVNQGCEFYNNLFKRFLKINKIEMYSNFNEGKSVAAERFIRLVKNKIYKHMAAVSKNFLC